jgi:hypothetical protein
MDYRSFKYDSRMYPSEIERSSNCFDNNLGFELGMAINSSCPRERRERAQPFFKRHYRKHSKQLVDALQIWIDKLRFTSYEYKGGELFKHIPERIEREYVEYMDYMKMHLKEAYPNLLPDPAEIESEHKNICTEIEKITTFPTSTIPYKPSYELLIKEKLRDVCPKLKGIHDVTLTQNNIYLNKYVFSIIFDTVKRQETKLTLSVKPAFRNNIQQLIYDGGTVIAQGTEEDMFSLKKTLEELISDELIKQRISEYEVLANRLKNDPKIQSLHAIARKMHTQIYGGRILGGYPVCDLCDPDKPVDLPSNVTSSDTNREN